MEIKPLDALNKLRNNLEAQATTLHSSVDYLQIFVEYVGNLEKEYNRVNTELTLLKTPKEGIINDTPEIETIPDTIGANVS